MKVTERELITKGTTFALYSDAIKKNCIETIQSIEGRGTLEVTIRPISKNKTSKQLAALFGLWIKHISEKTGESELAIHDRLKAQFLARIYFDEPMNLEQENWRELCVQYQVAGDMVKMKEKAKQISLAWATMNQMREYMSKIEHHYMDAGEPLPIPDKFHKAYRK